MSSKKNVRLVAALAESQSTGQEVAKLANIHRTTFSAILNLRSVPKPATAEAIAGVLGSTPEQLGLLTPEAEHE